MRFVSINDLTPGMVLGRPFIGALGELMLSSNTVLTDSLVAVIQNLRYSGLYIKDEFSDGIEPDDLISLELRTKSVGAIRRFMLDMQAPKSSRVSNDMNNIKGLVDKIIDEIQNVSGAMVNLIDLKSFDLYTFQHSVNVCVLACAMGLAFGVTGDRLRELALSAILHDIGKVFVPIPILNKPEKLNDRELEIVRKHPSDGGEYVRSKFFFNNSITLPIKQHHERYDGLGYPLKLRNEQISTHACIIAIADVYDAIMSNRPYHEAIMPSEAYEYIMGNSGSHFNPEFVAVFVKTVLPFPIGVSVRLSNGQTGIVYKNNPNFPMRPLLKLRPDGGGSERFLDLSSDLTTLGVTITSFL